MSLPETRFLSTLRCIRSPTYSSSSGQVTKTRPPAKAASDPAAPPTVEGPPSSPPPSLATDAADAVAGMASHSAAAMAAASCEAAETCLRVHGTCEPRGVNQGKNNTLLKMKYRGIA